MIPNSGYAMKNNGQRDDMRTLYMPIARLGEDTDYFPVSDDGDGLQFYSRKPDAAKAVKAHVKDTGGDYYVLEFKAYKTKAVPAQRRKSAHNYDWQRYTLATRPPIGRKVYIKAVNTETGVEFEDIAWRINRNMWNWKQSNRVVSFPSSFDILYWKQPRERGL